ncbi:MAG: hypothetical protein KJS97_08220 [Alphaproteobacteria bacterium]|nr:hypothetical protein [Alphaproteobacteria bacterium]
MSGNQGADGLAGRVFASRYRRGVLLAPGAGCLFAPILVIPGATLMNNLLAGVALALATLIVSAWIFTARRRQRPAVELSSAGMRLDGLPPTPWSQVVSVRRDPDTRADDALLVRLKTLPVRPTGALVSPLWRIVGEDTVRVRIGILEDPPSDVEDAFRTFLRGR